MENLENLDSSAPIKTYSLDEVAAMVLPPDMKSPRRWLMVRLNEGKIRGYRLGRTWRMTRDDVEDLIARHRKEPAVARPAEPETYPGGLTRRSWLYHSRWGIAGNPAMQGPRNKQPAKPIEKVMPAPSYFHPVGAEFPEDIAAMPALTETQQELLKRLQREGEVQLNGRHRKTIEALVKRDLATYKAEHVLNETHGYYGYRFTVRLRTDDGR